MGSWFKRQPTIWEQASTLRKTWTGMRAVWNTAWGRQPCIACAYDACEIVDATHTNFRMVRWLGPVSTTARVEDITWYCDHHARIKVILTDAKAVEAWLDVENLMES